MNLIPKNVYIDRLDDIVYEYNNTYHSTIKMKPVDVNSSSYIDFGIENNEKSLKFEVGDYVRILKFIDIFAAAYAPNWFEEVFLIKKLKILCHGHM